MNIVAAFDHDGVHVEIEKIRVSNGAYYRLGSRDSIKEAREDIKGFIDAGGFAKMSAMR